MCGGSDRVNTPPPAQPTYTAPDLHSLYAQYREKGTVPYSYYGQGAPTNADELARVRAAYPGAFGPNAAPTTPPAPPSSQNGFLRLLQAMRSRMPTDAGGITPLFDKMIETGNKQGR